MGNTVLLEWNAREDSMMETAPRKSERKKKQAYVPPRLVEYGSIAKLTQSGNGSGADGGLTAGMMMTCL
jgi:hypothetical protein